LNRQFKLLKYEADRHGSGLSMESFHGDPPFPFYGWQLMQNYYKILRVSQNATQKEIKKAYRSLAKKYHPDANPGNKEAENLFKLVNEAHMILGDETKKAEYDRRMFGAEASGPDGASPAQGSDTPRRQGANMTAAHFAGASKAFENFFGYDPKSADPKLNKKAGSVKPMKNSDIYKKLFGDR